MIAEPPSRIWTLQPEDQFEEIRAAKRQVSTAWLPVESEFVQAETPDPRYNLVGVGVGDKLTRGKSTGTLCIRLYVRKKYRFDEIPSKQRLDRALSDVLPHGVLTDVVEAGLLEQSLRIDDEFPDPTSGTGRARPGCSISPCGCGGTPVPTGTIAALLGESAHLLMTCAHVLRPRCSHAHDGVYFPDAYGSGRVIAGTQLLVGAEVGKENEVDIAVAELRETLDPEIMFIGGPKGIGSAAPRMPVHKFGRSSRYTLGYVDDLDFEGILLDRSWSPVRRIKYIRQITVLGYQGDAFSTAGDSGALVTEANTNAAIGVLVGGSPETSIVTPIDAVLKHVSAPLATG